MLAALMAVAASTPLRGSQELSQESPKEAQPENRRRRLMVKEVTCDLFLQRVMHVGDEPDESAWACEFAESDATTYGMHFARLSDRANDPRFRNAVSGRSTLSASNAEIDQDTLRMYIPSGASLQIDTVGRDDIIRSENPVSNEIRRRGNSFSRKLIKKPQGDLETVMVRIIDSRGQAPTRSRSQLINDTFEDDSCLKTQMEACSYNKVRIVPKQNDKINNGVYDLHVPFDFTANSDRQQFLSAAREQFDKEHGSVHNFDLVMFCMPAHSSGEQAAWGAFAYVNHPVSVYSNDWCGYASGQMHEVGHNLNLEHSGKQNVGEYDDATGLMGYSYASDDTKMCYNAAKSWQLHWYEDQVLKVNPLNAGNPVRRFTLNGVADYQKNREALVSLQLDQTSRAASFFVGYNRKIGINSGVKQDADMVTIVRKDEDADEYGYSWKVASLMVGADYTIENFNGEMGRDVNIKFIGLTNNDRDAIIQVSDVENAPEEEREACEEYTVEVKTDRYPGDTSWSIAETQGLGRGFGFSPEYDQNEHVYTTRVCLPYNAEYKFTIHDNYGDGICCQQGNGYYKIKHKNQVVLQGGESFKTETKTFSVGANPNPPAPTKNPTNAPVPATRNPTTAPVPVPAPEPTIDTNNCEAYIVKVTTDGFPEDTSWEVTQNGQRVAHSDPFTETDHEYATEICLTKGVKHDFVVTDSKGDGFGGDGTFSVTWKAKNRKVAKAPNDLDEFHTLDFVIDVPNTTNNPKPGRCMDKRGRFVAYRNTKKKTTCKLLTKRNKKKCNRRAKGKGMRIWQLCPRSCGECGANGKWAAYQASLSEEN